MLRFPKIGIAHEPGVTVRLQTFDIHRPRLRYCRPILHPQSQRRESHHVPTGSLSMTRTCRNPGSRGKFFNEYCSRRRLSWGCTRFSVDYCRYTTVARSTCTSVTALIAFARRSIVEKSVITYPLAPALLLTMMMVAKVEDTAPKSSMFSWR